MIETWWKDYLTSQNSIALSTHNVPRRRSSFHQGEGHGPSSVWRDPPSLPPSRSHPHPPPSSRSSRHPSPTWRRSPRLPASSSSSRCAECGRDGRGWRNAAPVGEQPADGGSGARKCRGRNGRAGIMNTGKKERGKERTFLSPILNIDHWIVFT